MLLVHLCMGGHGIGPDFSAVTFTFPAVRGRGVLMEHCRVLGTAPDTAHPISSAHPPPSEAGTDVGSLILSDEGCEFVSPRSHSVWMTLHAYTLTCLMS